MNEKQQQDNFNAKDHLFGLFCIFGVSLIIFLVFGQPTGFVIMGISTVVGCSLPTIFDKIYGVLK